MSPAYQASINRMKRATDNAMRTVSFRWLVSGAEHGVDRTSAPDQFLHTVVTFTLDDDEAGIRLSVVESGFATAVMDETARKRAYEGNTEGWAVEIALIKTHVEKQ